MYVEQVVAVVTVVAALVTFRFIAAARSIRKIRNEFKER